MGRSRNPLLVGVGVGVAVVILVVAGVYFGFQIGRNSPALTSATVPSPSPAKVLLITASPTSLMPEPSDFPRLYVVTGTQGDTLVNVPAEFETLQGVNGNRFSATLSIEIYPTIALAQDRFQHIVAFLGPSSPTSPRQYGDESHLIWAPGQSPPQLLLHWRDRNAVADVTISDSSRTASVTEMQAALYVIADRFSQRIEEA